MSKAETLLKAVSVYLIYFVYTYFGSYITSLFPNWNSSYVMMALDILFLIFMIYMYQNKMREDLKKIKKDYKPLKVIGITLLGVIAIVAVSIGLSIISSILQVGIDENTSAIQSMPLIYAIFKTMIFGSIAEELLFRESLNESIQKDYILVIVSAIIYTAMNFIFSMQTISIMQILSYLIPAIIISTIYVKNNRNIILAMFVKFAYNLVPLTILLLGI